MRGTVRLFGVGAIAVIAATAGMTTTPSWAGQPSTARSVVDLRPAGQQGLDARQVPGSIAYLRRTYGVSEAEALRRLRLQMTAQGLAGTLRQRVPAAYAGMWLDQAGGGRLVIEAKVPAAVATALGAVADRSHIVVHPAARSLDELDALRARVAAQLGDGPDSLLLPRVDETTNQVVVWKRDWLIAAGGAAATTAHPAAVADTGGQLPRPFTAPAAAALGRVVAASAGAVVVRSMPRPHPLTTAADFNQCFPLYCTGYGAMRGGIRLDIPRDDATVGGCTAGFNIRATEGTYAGQPFVLTGGHCVNSGRHTHLDTAYHQGTPVLREIPALAVNNFPFDYALMPYTDTATAQTWLDGTPEHNLVLAWCRNGGFDSDVNTRCVDGDANDDGRVHITNLQPVADVHVGAVVCATGAGASSVDYTDAVDSGPGAGYRPGTRCGIVTGQSNGAIDTDLCARAGDSGGPLFSEVTHSAIGILEGNTQDRSGPCQDGESNNYVPVSTILGAVNGQPAAAGSTFQVITTAKG
ncbi:MAG: streptogrisin [Micromonosporaceae bacterium]|nr:streptogrisin [Micromonosporaceae bacterium]